MNLSAILHEIDAEIERLQKAKALLSASSTPAKKRRRPAKTASLPSSAPVPKRRTLSPEAKAKIAEAQRRRWAAQKKAAPAKKAPAKKTPAKKAPAKAD